jgi:hypothetical protein
MRRPPRVIAAVGAAVVCVVAALTAVVAPVGVSMVRAEEDLGLSSVTAYRIDGDAGLVRVTGEYTFVNNLFDQRDGNIIRRPYFSGATLPVPAAAQNVVVATDGRPLVTRTEEVGAGELFVVLAVDFARNLFSGRQTTVTITYDLVGAEPRSEDPTRVNEAYMSFDAWGYGDPEQVEVRVEIPRGWEYETFGSDMKISVADGVTTLSASAIEDPFEFAVLVSARRDAELVERRVSLDDADAGSGAFTIEHWPDDPAWADFVETNIVDGIPVMSGLIGLPWPEPDTLVVRQTVTPYLYGYAGWYSAIFDEIEVGEDLDAEVVLHELSHAWFNDEFFIDRWMNEGFAQLYSNLAVEQTGGTPLDPEKIDPAAPGAVPLIEWTTPRDFDDGEDDSEDFGYNASFWVIRALYDEIGAERMSDVLVAADRGTTAYPGTDPTERISSAADGDVRPVDWRRLLDLLERVGGSIGAEQILRDHVLPESAFDVLDERRRAVERFDELDELDGDWVAPLGARTAMTEWDFELVEPIVGAAAEVLDARTELLAAADELGVTVPDGTKGRYRVADAPDDLTAIVTELDDLTDAIAVVAAAEAREAEPDPFTTRIGLIGVDVATPLAEARLALVVGDAEGARAAAAELGERLDAAASNGRSRVLRSSIGAGLVVLALLIVVALLVRRRRRRRRASIDVAVDVARSRDDDVPTDADAADVPVAAIDNDAGTTPVDHWPSPLARDDATTDATTS